MKNRLAEIVAIALLMPLAAGALLIASCTATPDGVRSDGERWFGMQHCDGCHGKSGLGGRAPVLKGAGLSYRMLKAKVRNSGSAIMPSYSTAQLSDKELADIFAFLDE